jgi:hypothetical protein
MAAAMTSQMSGLAYSTAQIFEECIDNLQLVDTCCMSSVIVYEFVAV